MSRELITLRLKGHRLDTMSQDSGNHCVCGSDSRFEQHEGRDKPWAPFEEHLADMVIAGAMLPQFPLARRFTVGERICIPGRSGSYPDHSKNEWGYVTEIESYLPYRLAENLIVTLDGKKPRAINPDVVGHGDDPRWAAKDPNPPEKGYLDPEPPEPTGDGALVECDYDGKHGRAVLLGGGWTFYGEALRDHSAAYGDFINVKIISKGEQ